MANCYIDFKCTQQLMQRTDSRTVAAGASGCIYARFELCEKWTGLNLCARFEYGQQVFDVVVEDNAALVPHEVLQHNGFNVSLYGEDGSGARLTGNQVFVPVALSVDVDGVEPIPSSPSLLQQFFDEAQAAVDVAASVREDADNGLFNGQPFRIVKTYDSVAAMQADLNGTDVDVNEFVMINSGVEDADNAKLYMKVEDDGVLSWSYICDLSGATGVGVKGDAATVEIGSTTGLTAWATPTVSNSGTANDAVLNFGIPKTPNFTATASTLAEGAAATVTATKNTSTGNLALAFGLPRGATGATGAAGRDGTNGADGVGIPTGGATGQVLAKSSATNYATHWVDAAGGMETVTTTGTGSAYKVTSTTVAASPANGARLMVIPHLTSSVLAPTLSVNNGTAYPIKRRLSTDSGDLQSLTSLYVFKIGDAIELMFDAGGSAWILVNNPRQNVTDLYGTLPISAGGTGATTAAAARTSLGAAATTHNHSAADINSGTLSVARGGTGVTTAAAIGLLSYPVGAIYISTVSTSPASLFGGSWTRIQDTFLLAAGSTYAAGATGGESAHTLTVNEMPAHDHRPKGWALDSAYQSGQVQRLAVDASNYDNWTQRTTSEGGGAAHNNMPPYLAVYVWKRTA